MVKKKSKPKPKIKKKPIKKPAKPVSPKKKKLKQLISACKLWDLVTTKAHGGGYAIPIELRRYGSEDIYADGDYKQLSCRITGDKAELTVGASDGHKAKADLTKKTFDYYDNRGYNNRVIWTLLNQKIKGCKRNETGVHCKGLNSVEKLNHAFRVMAVPTSMDFRENYCQLEHYDEQCREAEVKFFNSGPKHTVLKVS